MVPGTCLYATNPRTSGINTSIRIDKRFYRTGEAIRRWVMVIFETQQRFPPQAAQECMRGLVNSCRDVGKQWLILYILFNCLC